MPMKLNVGLARKVGLPEYSSMCASCNVEVELNGSLVFDDLKEFHRRVRQAYVACQQAVSDELARQQPRDPAATPAQSRQVAPPEDCVAGTGGNGASGNGNGASNGSQASEKQMTYIQQLARQIRGLGVRKLETLAGKMFNQPLANLSSLNASSMIDVLKAVKAGEVNLDNVLNGAAS